MTFQGLMRFKVFVCVCMTLLGVAGCGTLPADDRATLKEIGTKLEYTFEKQVDRTIAKAGDKYDDVLRKQEERERIDRLDADIKEVRKELRDDVKEVRKELRYDVKEVRSEILAKIKEVRDELLDYDKQYRTEQHQSKVLLWIGIGVVIPIFMFILTVGNLLYRRKNGKNVTEQS